jgi:hypothetical protein
MHGLIASATLRAKVIKAKKKPKTVKRAKKLTSKPTPI